MEIKDIYKKLREFVMTATGYAGNRVIFANQLSSSRPKKPFITIDIGSFTSIGTPIVNIIDDSEVANFTVPMICNAEFECYSDKVHEAETTLEKLHMQLFSEMQNDVFKGELAARNANTNTTALPKMLNEQYESRAILEINIGFNKEAQYKLGTIETVVITEVLNQYTKELTITKGDV